MACDPFWHSQIVFSKPICKLTDAMPRAARLQIIGIVDPNEITTHFTADLRNIFCPVGLGDIRCGKFDRAVIGKIKDGVIVHLLRESMWRGWNCLSVQLL